MECPLRHDCPENQYLTLGIRNFGFLIDFVDLFTYLTCCDEARPVPSCSTHNESKYGDGPSRHNYYSADLARRDLFDLHIAQSFSLSSLTVLFLSHYPKLTRPPSKTRLHTGLEFISSQLESRSDLSPHPPQKVRNT